MTAPAPKAAEAPRLVTPSGASAEVDGERLVVRDTRGAIVVVFDAAAGTAEVRVPEGDLTLAAPRGKVILAGVEVELRGERKVSIQAPEVSTAAGRLEVSAERILESAGEVYREIEGLYHTRAGRVRQLVKDVYQLLAKRTSIVAEEDAAMDGKRVLLG